MPGIGNHPNVLFLTILESKESMKLFCNSLSRVALILLTSVFLFTASCSKKKETSVVAKKAQATDVAAELTNSDSLVKSIPSDAYCFVSADLSHAAYKRLLASPWSPRQNKFSAKDILTSDGFPKKVAQILEGSGILSEQPQVIEDFVGEVALFATLPQPASEPLTSIGLLLRSSKKDELPNRLAVIRDEIKKAGIEVKDESISGAKGFSFSSYDLCDDVDACKAAAKVPPMIFVAWNNGTGVFSFSETVIQQVLTAKQGVPQFVNSENFKRATQDFPSSESRYGFGYIDLTKIVEHIAKAENKSDLIASVSKSPIEAISLSSAMADIPSAIVKLLFNPRDENQKKVFEIFGSSNAKSMLEVLPADPLLFISLDGQTLLRAKALLAANAPAPVQDQLKVLDAVQRVGLVVNSPSSGGSMLPVPDLLIVLESNAAEQSEQQISQIVTSYMGTQGGAQGLQWQENEIDGVKVKSMMSPLGFGMFLTRHKNFVIASSTDNQLRALLKGINGKGEVFASMASGMEKSILSERDTLFNWYMSFDRFGTTLENMGQMLLMFAPPDDQQKAREYLTPEAIEQIRKMGVMLGSTTIDKGAITIESYQMGKSKGKA